MGKEASFDVVSRADMNEVRNAVNMAQKEIATRYDFKQSVSRITLEADHLVLLADDQGKLKQVVDLLEEKLVHRKVSLKALQYGKVEDALGGTVRQHVDVAQGIPEEKAKAMNKLLRQRLQEGQGADPGRHRARVLAQQGRTAGGDGGVARRGLGPPAAVRQLPLTASPGRGSDDAAVTAPVPPALTPPVRFHLVTLGCPKNEADSDRLERTLVAARARARRRRPRPTSSSSTRAASSTPPKRSRSTPSSRRPTAAHARGARVAAVGCLVERYRRELEAELPEVRSVVRPRLHGRCPPRSRRRPLPTPGRGERCALKGAGPGVRARSTPTSKSPTAVTVAARSAPSRSSRGATRRVPPEAVLADAARRPRRAERGSSSSSVRTPRAGPGPVGAGWSVSWPSSRRSGRCGYACSTCSLRASTTRCSGRSPRTPSPTSTCRCSTPPAAFCAAWGARGDGDAYLALLARVRSALRRASPSGRRSSRAFPGRRRPTSTTLLDFIASAGLAVAGVFPFDPQEGTRAASTARPGPPRGARSSGRRASPRRSTRAAASLLDRPRRSGRSTFSSNAARAAPTARRWAASPRRRPTSTGATLLTGRAVRRGRLVRARVVGALGYDVAATTTG